MNTAAAKERCFASLFRELCGLKAGLRRAVIAPASWVEDVRRIIRALEIRPAPLFFSIPLAAGHQLDAAILSTDYLLLGEIGSTLFYEGEIIDVDCMLGRVCGYPSCCVQQFELDKCIDHAYERYKKQSEEYDPYDLELFEDEEGWVWVFANEPISHIPCEPGCIKTMDLMMRYTDICRACKNKPCKRDLALVEIPSM